MPSDLVKIGELGIGAIAGLIGLISICGVVWFLLRVLPRMHAEGIAMADRATARIESMDIRLADSNDLLRKALADSREHREDESRRAAERHREILAAVGADPRFFEQRVVGAGRHEDESHSPPYMGPQPRRA